MVVFFDKLNQAMIRNDSLLCVGLNPDPVFIPTGVGILDFNKSIIDATANSVCAYIPNLAFYEALGPDGWLLLKESIDYVPEHIPVIADAKRGDIGNTSRFYAEGIFDELGCDAVTVNPYMGFDSIEPFLAYHEKGIFVLCLTSNQETPNIQEMPVKLDGGFEQPLYRVVARKAFEWNTSGNIGLVMCGTRLEELRTIRCDFPTMKLLVLGEGLRSGDLNSVLAFGADNDGKGLIVSLSKQIIYASGGKDYAQVAGETATDIVNSLNRLGTAWESMRDVD